MHVVRTEASIAEYKVVPPWDLVCLYQEQTPAPSGSMSVPGAMPSHKLYSKPPPSYDRAEDLRNRDCTLCGTHESLWIPGKMNTGCIAGDCNPLSFRAWWLRQVFHGNDRRTQTGKVDDIWCCNIAR